MEKVEETVEVIEVKMVDLKPLVEFDDVMKVDIRLGMIVEAERVPKSEKLLRLLVQFNSDDHRVCVTNIGETLEADELVGHLVPFVVNMPPRDMFKITTEVMICPGVDLDGGFDLAMAKVGTKVL